MIRSETETSIYWNVLRALQEDGSALRYFTNIRWGYGEFCPYCDHEKIYHLADGKTHKCAACNRGFSITVGTIFEGTKLPLGTWILAIAYLCEHGGQVGSTELANRLGLSQKTAWYMLARLRRASLTLSFQKPLPIKRSIRNRQLIRSSVMADQAVDSRSQESAKRVIKKTADSEMRDPVSGRIGRLRSQSSRVQPLGYSGSEPERAAIENELQKLHRRRDVAGGAHPSDASRAMDAFRRLADQGYKPNPDGCYQWALVRGWEDFAAEELAAIVEELN
jgi:transposase-like protein